MKKSKFTEPQINFSLMQSATDVTVTDVSGKWAYQGPPFYNWK